MASVNKVVLIGRIGQSLELRKTQSGSSVLSFSMATSEKFKGKDGQQKEETEWHNCTAWNRQAEVIAQYCSKGSELYVEGKLKTRDWEDNGVKKYKTEILVREFQFLGGKKQEQQQGGNDFGEPPVGFGDDQQQGEW